VFFHQQPIFSKDGLMGLICATSQEVKQQELLAPNLEAGRIGCWIFCQRGLPKGFAKGVCQRGLPKGFAKKGGAF